jgi:hypothetical protein
MALRDDYILRYLALVRQAITQAVKLRQAGQPDHALRVLLQAQENLFARPIAAFAGFTVDEQLAFLAAGESAANAREKRLAYAALLREAGFVYLERERHELAESAFQLALHVMLTVIVEQPDAAEQHLPVMRELLGRVRPEALHAPVQELLAAVGESRAV